MGCIYRAYCPASGKFYVGQTKHDSWEKRYAFMKYRYVVKERAYRKATMWERAMNKHRMSGLQFKTLMNRDDPEMLDRLEKFFISYYDSADPKYGYNVETGGRRGKEQIAANSRKSSKSNGIACRWYSRSTGVVVTNAKRLSLIYGLDQAHLNDVRRGRQRFCDGWVCLDAPVHAGPNQRNRVWNHLVSGEFVGSTTALKLAHPEQNLYAPHLASVAAGRAKKHKGWRFVRVPTLEEEVGCRIKWADSSRAASIRIADTVVEA